MKVSGTSKRFAMSELLLICRLFAGSYRVPLIKNAGVLVTPDQGPLLQILFDLFPETCRCPDNPRTAQDRAPCLWYVPQGTPGPACSGFRTAGHVLCVTVVQPPQARP